MNTADKTLQANDYVVAKTLNEKIIGIISLVYAADAHGLSSDKEIDKLNRSYILLAHELDSVYSRNPELLAIEPEPIWKRFDVLKGYALEIKDLIDATDDNGHAHTARVEKLCVIAGTDIPKYTPEQLELLESSDEVIRGFAQKLVRANEERKANIKHGWEIPAYNLTYRLDGTILVNQVMKLKKVHAGSITERLLEQSLKNPNTEFKPDLGKTSRNISTIISSAGFTPVLRDLFFPTVKNDTVIFRPNVSRLQADTEGIDTTSLDSQLKSLGAVGVVVFEPKSLN